jgi:hypothetical protein
MSQLRQVDNGDNSARMHEVVNQTIGQIREWYLIKEVN